MKKISAILMLLVFIISMISVYAENENTGTDAKPTTVANVPPKAVVGKQNLINPAVAADAATDSCIREYIKKHPDVSPVQAKTECNQGTGMGKEIKKQFEPKPVVDGTEKPRPALINQDIRTAKMKQFVQARPEIAKVVTNVAEYRLRNIQRLSNDTILKDKVTDMFNGLTADKAQVLSHLTRAQQKNLLNGTDAVDKLKNLKLMEVKKEEMFKSRIIAQNKLSEAKNRYDLAKKNYVDLVKDFKDKKDEFDKLKAKIAACKDSDGCKADQDKAQAAAKEYVYKSIKAAIEHLKKIKEKAGSSEYITSTDSSDIESEVDSAISKLEALATRLDAATTKDDIKKIASEVASLWKDIKEDAKRDAAKVVVGTVGNVVKRAEHLEGKLDCAVLSLEEQGIDVAGIDSKIDDFSSLVTSAKEDYETARKYLADAKSNDDANAKDYVTKTHTLIKQAENKIEKAHSLLKEIVREIKAAGGDISKCGADDETGSDDREYVVVDDDGSVAIDPRPVPILGGDEDEHGCKASAGYTWCAAKKECIRNWETECLVKKSCSEDSDCVRVNAGCCGCGAGGKVMAVHEDNADMWKEDIAKRCAGMMCPTVMSNDPSCSGTAKCINNVCKIEGGTAGGAVLLADATTTTENSTEA